MKRRILRCSSVGADALPAELHPLLKRVYSHRGVSSAAELDLALESLLPHGSLKGITVATELLADAIAKDRHICIVGDYDADGATSTALMISALKGFGAATISYLVPDRFRFGYGLTPPIVDLAAQRGAQLLVTVDNGIASIEGVTAAREHGMQVLITDHHLPGRELPAADAIVNPNQPGCEFPSKSLAGVGVAFYTMMALRAHLRSQGVYNASEEPRLASLLDLVALGTVADVVPLDHNNRVLVNQGLRLMRARRARLGVLALIQVSGRDPARLSAGDLGFMLGPRLNAAGRLEDMAIGIECLLSSEAGRAQEIARRLDDLNRDRREIQSQMQQEALTAIDKLERSNAAGALPFSLCVFDEGWHQGVIGLVAGRLKERYHRPAIAFAPGEEPGLLKGSARSVAGLHIRDALDTVATQHPGLITKFGGHAMAAGLSLNQADLPRFISAFEDETRRWLSLDMVDGALSSDGRLSADEFTLESAELLRSGGPWGQGFSEPLFDGEFEVVDARIVAERHLKLRLMPKDGSRPVDAIAFNCELPAVAGDRLLMAYRLDVNEYQGRRSLQLIVEHVEHAS